MSELTAQGKYSPMSDYRNLEERLRNRHLLGDCVLAAGVIKALREENERLAAEIQSLKAENARLAAALRRAVDSDGGLCYRDDDDEVGNHSCCFTLSFKPHTHDCWVVQARAALSAVPNSAPAQEDGR